MFFGNFQYEHQGNRTPSKNEVYKFQKLPYSPTSTHLLRHTNNNFDESKFNQQSINRQITYQYMTRPAPSQNIPNSHFKYGQVNPNQQSNSFYYNKNNTSNASSNSSSKISFKPLNLLPTHSKQQNINIRYENHQIHAKTLSKSSGKKISETKQNQLKNISTTTEVVAKNMNKKVSNNNSAAYISPSTPKKNQEMDKFQFIKPANTNHIQPASNNQTPIHKVSMNEDKHKYFRDNLVLKSELQKLQDRFSKSQYENYILKSRLEKVQDKSNHKKTDEDCLQAILKEQKNRRQKNQVQIKFLRDKIKDLQNQIGSISSHKSSMQSQNNQHNHSIVQPYLSLSKKCSTAVQNRSQIASEYQKLRKMYDEARIQISSLTKQKKQIQKQFNSIRNKLDKNTNNDEIMSFNQHRNKLGFKGSASKLQRNYTQQLSIDNMCECLDNSNQSTNSKFLSFKTKTPKRHSKISQNNSNCNSSPYGEDYLTKSPKRNNAYYKIQKKVAQNCKQMQEDRQELRKKMNILREQNQQLLKQNKAYYAKIQETYTKNIEKDMEIQGLKHRYSKQIDERDKIIERISLQNEHVKQGKQQVKQNNFSFRPDSQSIKNNQQINIIKSQSKHIEQLTNQLQSLKIDTTTQLQQKHIQIKSLRKVNEELVDCNTEYQDKLIKLNHKVTQYIKNIQQLKDEIDNKQQKIEILNKRLTSINEQQITEYKQKLVEQNEKVNEYKQKLIEQNEKINEYKQKLIQQNEKINKKDEQIMRLNSSNEQYKRNKKELQQKLEQRIRQIEREMVKYHRLQQQYNKDCKQRLKYQKQNTQLKQNIKLVENKREQMQIQLQALQQKYQKQNSIKNLQLQQKLDKFRILNHQLSTSNLQLSNQIASNKQKILSLQQLINNNLLEINQLKANNLQLSQQLIVLKQTIIINQKNTQQYSQLLQSRQSIIKELNDHIKQLNTLKQQQQNRLNDHIKQLKQINTQKDLMNKQLQKKSKQIENLNAQIKKYQQEIQAYSCITAQNNREQDDYQKKMPNNLLIQSQVFVFNSENQSKLQGKVAQLQSALKQQHEKQMSLSRQHRQSLQQKDLKNQQIQKQLVQLTIQISELKHQLQKKQQSYIFIDASEDNIEGSSNQSRSYKIPRKRSQISDTSLTTSKELWASKQIKRGTNQSGQMTSSFQRLQMLQAAINENQQDNQKDQQIDDNNYVEVNYHALMHICNILGIQPIQGEIMSSIIEYLQYNQQVYMVMEFYVQILDLFGITGSQVNKSNQSNMNMSTNSLKSEKDLFINLNTHNQLLKQIKNFRESMKMMLNKTKNLQDYNQQLMKDMHRLQKQIKKMQHKIEDNLQGFLVKNYSIIIDEVNQKNIAMQIKLMSLKYNTDHNQSENENESNSMVAELINTKQQI